MLRGDNTIIFRIGGKLSLNDTLIYGSDSSVQFNSQKFQQEVLIGKLENAEITRIEIQDIVCKPSILE